MSKSVWQVFIFEVSTFWSQKHSWRTDFSVKNDFGNLCSKRSLESNESEVLFLEKIKKVRHFYYVLGLLFNGETQNRFSLENTMKSHHFEGPQKSLFDHFGDSKSCTMYQWFFTILPRCKTCSRCRRNAPLIWRNPRKSYPFKNECENTVQINFFQKSAKTLRIPSPTEPRKG